MTFSEIQSRISEIVNDKSATAADYLAVSKKLAGMGGVPAYFRKIRAAFLSSYTIQGLPEVFRARAVFHNLVAEVYDAPYAQISQEIFNKDSGLYAFAPDIIYIFAEQKDFLSSAHLEELIEVLKSKTKARVVLGIAGDERGGAESKGYYNFNFDDFLAKVGREENWYTKYKDLGDMRLAPQAFPKLAEGLLAYAVAASGNTKKCLIVDLDNTLWSGVVGEDGLGGIVPNKKLQEYLLGLYKRGVVLAINSKNNLEDALEAIDKHPDMLLRRDHFAAWRINWNSKDWNITELAEELSLGTDSFVFIDDDYLNISLIRANESSVAVMHPDQVFDYAGFHSFALTDEDARRGEMYVEERRRKEHKERFKSPEEFLRDLKMEVAIARVSEESVARASQLTQKTNQFNLTTRRYSEDEIRKFIKGGWGIWTVGAKDVFGDYGIVGLAMFHPSEARLDNFLLSCRVLGRGIENVFLAHIFREAKKDGVMKLAAEFIPTKKNKPAEKFLPEAGFLIVKKDGTAELYEYDLSKEYRVPEYVKMTTVI